LSLLRVRINIAKTGKWKNETIPDVAYLVLDYPVIEYLVVGMLH